MDDVRTQTGYTNTVFAYDDDFLVEFCDAEVKVQGNYYTATWT